MWVRVQAFLLAAAAGVSIAAAQPVKIVGLGVSRCHVFNEQIAEAPAMEDAYFLWAEGFMSGVLLRTRSGQDDTLDLVRLAPDEQRRFLRDYCRGNPLRFYYNGVAALYHRLDGTSLDFLM